MSAVRGPRPASSARLRRVRRARFRRGMTLLEVLVSLGILVMISLLIYGAFDSLSRGKKAESMRADRARQGRDAMDRIVREISSAYLSMHTPSALALQTRATAFIGTSSSTFDRVDFSSFAHRRVQKEARESDQAEIGYFVAPDPEVNDKMDLLRREQSPMDLDPKRGGVVNVLAEDVESFDIKYLDPMTGIWSDTWDTTQVTGQTNRLPLQVKVSLVLKGVKNTPPFRFTTKFAMPMQQPLSFGIPR